MSKKIEKQDKRTDTTPIKVVSTITFIASIAYLCYYLISTSSIMTNLEHLIMPLFVFVINLILFVSSLKINEKSFVYPILSVVMIIFMIFTFLIDKKIVSLPEEEKMISYNNKSYSDFNDWASIHKIEVVVEYEYSDEVEKGNIIRLDVNEGALVKDINKITATISNGPDYDKIVIIPSMLGWNVDDAIEYIKTNFLNNVTINFENSDTEKDIIFKQSKNGEIRRNNELILTASFGGDIPNSVEMIDLTNKSLFEAVTWLKRNNIKYELKYEFNDKDKDSIMSQSIEKGKEIIVADDVVELTLSKGKAIKVLDFSKMDIKEITDWIIKNKLKVEFEEAYDQKIETGKVISQDIAPNSEVQTDTLIKVTISKGQIKMQKFNSLYEFKDWANKYNIKYNESYEYSSIPKGSVISYSYNKNDIIDPDSVIYVKVSLGQAITIPSFIGKSKSDAQNICNSLGIRCSFVIGNYNNNYNENIVYVQSRNNGNKVASGSSITLTLSKGIPKTCDFAILNNELSVGNADATINNLKNILASRCPGVNFTFQKVKDNTLNSGLLSPNSPTKIGAKLTQGNTYTVYIVSN